MAVHRDAAPDRDPARQQLIVGDEGDPARELRRVADRLATLGPERLTRPGQGGRAPADIVHADLQYLADRAADLQNQPRRTVPVLAPHGLGDQLTVLVGELLTAGGTDPAVPSEVHARLVALRRAL